MKRISSFCALLVIFLASHALAEIKLPSLFADHMVLQRGMAVPVWGTVGPNQEVTFEIAGKTAKAKADASGNFMAKLPELEYGGNAVTMTIDAGGEKLVLKDVLIGDVWVASGQSNMEWTVRMSSKNPEDLEKTAKEADHPNLRLFTFPKTTLLEPTKEVRGKWEVCSPETVKNFSAVAYHFGRNIHEMEKVPVGLISNAWGGKPVESFMSDAAMKADPAFKPLLDKKEQAGKNLPAAKEAYEKKLAEWEKSRAAANPTTKPVNKPQEPMGGQDSSLASNIYNGMVFPVIPYAIKGAIWYQGESNAGRAEQYRALFPAMITDWRKQWGQGDFPFIWVQLANFKERKAEPGDSDWAELREAQSMALKVPNTAQAVIIDIGEAKDIHPKNKHDVGKRLALAAERIAYGKNDVVYSGPVFDSMKVEGNKARLKFLHAEGLQAKGGELKGFAVAGEDKKFVWADAKVEGDSVVVSASGVEKPVAVRYGWADNPECNLYNGAGLPASPFRTDDFPMITAGKVQ
jgi:sialate O-acetylesterase